MDFWEALFMLLFGESGSIPTDYEGQSIPVFVVGASVVGTVIIVLDLVLFSIRGRSILDLGYAGIFPTLIVVVLWGVGAGLAALLGAWWEVFDIGRSGCLAVGVGWPAIVPRLIESAGKEEELQQPTGES